MKKKLALGAVIVAAAIAGTAAFFASSRERDVLVLYGNVDDRQINLAFLISERIAEIVPEEGALVSAGERVGKLETVRLENNLNAARAAVEARRAQLAGAQAQLEKVKNGTRAEDIASARAAVEAVRAAFVGSSRVYERYKKLVTTGGISQQETDLAEADFLSKKSELAAAESVLARLLAGERAEDVAAAEAQFSAAQAELTGAQAQLAICEQALRDAELFAPCAAIVRKRLLEPGEMAGPSAPALSLAVVSPKRVRVWIPETLLTRVKNGVPARVCFDGSPREFAGTVGFISPTAEFTPKNVETPELRTSLVYECRIFVDDPENELKLGAPATVVFPQISGEIAE